MNKRAIRWLLEELPQLVAQGILTPETEARLRAHYAGVEPAKPARLAVILFSVIGALLIGAGIILILAHNWEQLPRPLRTLIAFLPLISAQTLAFWVLAKRPSSLAWREGIAALTFLMIGASISLVGQTYHISGDFARFLLTWMILGLPLIFVLDAVVPALLYLWGVTSWAGQTRWEDGGNAGYWILIAVLIIPIWRWMHNGHSQVRPILLLWGLCLSVTIGAGLTIDHVMPGFWIILYSGLFALMVLSSETWSDRSDGFWSRPLLHFGAGGALVFSFVLSFRESWYQVARGFYVWDGDSLDRQWAMPDTVIGFLIISGALVLLVTTIRRKAWFGLVFGLLPVLAILGYALSAFTESPLPAAGLFNLYLLTVGIWLLVIGVRTDRQGQMNVGLLSITALIIARFFDSDLSFLLRGLVFIALGIAFLAANLIMVRRKGGNREEK